MHERSHPAPPSQSHPAPFGSTEGRAVDQDTILQRLARALRGAGLALLAVALTVGVLTVVQRRSQALVLHGREVARLAATTLRLMTDQETALRGYLLTRDTLALAPDQAAQRRLAPTLDSLLTATADNPVQHAQATRIRDAIARWQRGYRTEIVALVGTSASGAIDPDRERLGTALFDALRADIAQFLAAEEVLYRERVRREQAVGWAALGAVVVEVLFLRGILGQVGREAQSRTRLVFAQQEELEAQAGHLHEQAAMLEEQAVELEAQAEELARANRDLSETLGEQARTLEVVQASEARFRSVVQTATDAIISSDAQGRILFWNASAEKVYGYTAEEAVGAQLAMLYPDARRASHRAEYARLVTGEATELLQGAVLRDACGKDGRIFPVELAVSRWRAGEETFVTSIVRDVSARVALEARLAHQATHDVLTGLANRTCFQERVEAALARQAAHPERVAVLFLDLDDFKAVNDTAGHAVGNRLLVAVAARLLEVVGDSMRVARLGGDEFGILLSDVAHDADAEAIASQLIAALRRPVILDDREVTVGGSVGLARGAPGLDTDALLRNADTAMYAAKEEGKGRHAWFAASMHAAIVERLRIQADLAPALERGEFRLAFQPIVTLDDEHVQGVEALVRWAHPERGLVPPMSFIPIAETSGQIVPLGRWVLAEACRMVATFPGTPYVTVNISGRQLTDEGLTDDVAAALRASGLAPARLVLEITESVLMADTEGMLARLHALKALGVRLAIDDFGTGYSSLRYLQRFPVDVLKIDRSFVDRVDHDDHDAALVRTIVALGEMLGLTTVAEGIERVEQREHLRALGCGLGQGFHFARPLDRTALLALLARGAESECSAA